MFMKLNVFKSMKTSVYYAALGLVLISIFLSCGEFKNPDQIPAFVFIETPTKEVVAGQGSNAHDITEAYFYANNEFLGVYHLDDSFPVLSEGPTELTVFSGIRRNGISDAFGIYTFYAPYSQTLNLTPGQVDTIRPVARYTNSSKFLFIEDFETAHIFVHHLDGDESARMTISTSEVFEGDRSGLIEVDTDNNIVEVATEFAYSDLTPGNPVYLELNVKNECAVFLGFVAYDGVNLPNRFYKVQLNPNNEWRKIYLELTDEIGRFRNAIEFRFAILAIYDEGNPIENQRAFFDNIKLLYL